MTREVKILIFLYGYCIALFSTVFIWATIQERKREHKYLKRKTGVRHGG